MIILPIVKLVMIMILLILKQVMIMILPDKPELRAPAEHARVELTLISNFRCHGDIKL